MERSGYLQQRQVAKIENIRDKRREIEKAQKEIEAIRVQNEQDIEKAQREIEAIRVKNEHDREAIRIIAEEKSQGFSWLAKAYADYFYLQNL